MRRKGIIHQSIETGRSAGDESMEAPTRKTDLGASTGEEQPLPDMQAENMSAHILRLARQSEGRDGEAENSPLRLFGVLVGAIRRKQGLRLEDLANRSRLPVEQLAAIELGTASFEEVLESLRPLGDALGGRYVALSRALADLTLNT